MSESIQSLTSDRRLMRSVIWNFIGLTAPLLAGLIAIPMLIDGMGKERFGLLAIIWMGVGYFSLFDMGLGRALTKLVSERLGKGRNEDMGALLWTALWLILGLGVIGATILFLCADPLIRHVLNVETALEAEAISAFRVLAAGIPFVIITSALIGILEAHQRFGLIVAIRIPLGLMTFIGPLFSLQFTPSLVWATLIMLASRIIASLIYYWAAANQCSELTKPDKADRLQLNALIHFGSWLTVSNIIGPLMVYFDRFLLGAIMTMTAVTYYVTPYEVLSRLQLLSVAIMSVLFPAMSAAFAANRGRLVHLYERTARALVVVMLPATSALFLFAPEWLDVWLGSDFRQQSTSIVQWLALGWLINVMAQAPFTLLQSTGRPDLIAKTHVAELIPYLILLWFMTTHFGIAGTAAAWCLRVFVDTIIFNEIIRRALPELNHVCKKTYVELVVVVIGAGILANITAISLRVIALIFVIIVVLPPALHLGRELLGHNIEKKEGLSL